VALSIVAKRSSFWEEWEHSHNTHSTCDQVLFTEKSEKFHSTRILMSLKEKTEGDTTSVSRPFFTYILQSLFKLTEYQAGFGAEALELFRPSKERNKLLLRTCAFLESFVESFSPTCVAGIIVDDRTKPAPCEPKHATFEQ